MRVALDYDGVISANWSHYFQLAFDLLKSKHSVYIITAAKHNRAQEIQSILAAQGFHFSGIFTRPIDFISTYKNIGEWKKKIIQENAIDLWFDNEIKIYEQAGIDFSDLKTAIVRI